MSTKALGQIIGDKQLIKQLESLTSSSRELRRQKKSIVQKGLTVLKRAVKRVVPVDDGDLRKSITTKLLLNYEALGIVGVDKNYVSVDEDGQKSIPVAYDHLQEFGYTLPNGTSVPGKHYMVNAQNQSKREVQTAMVTQTNKVIQRLLAKNRR